MSEINNMNSNNSEIISDDAFWCYLENVKQAIIQSNECAPDVNVGVGYLIESAYDVPVWNQILLKEYNLISSASLTLTSKIQFINKIISLLNMLDSKEFYAAFFIYSQLRNVDRVDKDNYLYFCIYVILLGKDIYYNAINDKHKFDLNVQNALAYNTNQMNISPLDFLDCFADDNAKFYHDLMKSMDGKDWVNQQLIYLKINDKDIDLSAKHLYPYWYANTLQLRKANEYE